MAAIKAEVLGVNAILGDNNQKLRTTKAFKVQKLNF